ncbi:DUF2153 domain-containing protein [Thermogladius sp. 4427co]|uniref:DUF2153 domain-containing protein n=1 Tax=Thermogladius sp. 4427co TaxID=3450718 RepID=UPI003F78BEAF
MADLFSNLESWVKRQIEVKESFKKAESDYKEADRLALILLSRMAFQHMMRTIEAFDQWLKDPAITAHMPREMLVELWEKLRPIFYGLIDLDIEHTSKYSEYLKKLSTEGKLNPLLFWEKGEKEHKRIQPQI